MRKQHEFDKSHMVKLIFGDSHDNHGRLNCPKCGFRCVHFNGDFKTVPGKDNYESGTGYRGNAWVIRGYCENGCEFEICFCAHKGDIYVFAR